jgi:hypothetical protein
MKLIGICGRARSGKDTAADYIVEECGFAKYSMAEPIRDMLDSIRVNPYRDKENTIPMFGKSPRQMMQTLGTEWGRNCVNEDIWLNLAKDLYNILCEDGEHYGMVIPDIRFENEAEWIRKNGLLIRIVRPDAMAVASHSSETGVSTEAVDEIIWNNGSLDLLYRKLNVVMGIKDGKEAVQL